MFVVFKVLSHVTVHLQAAVDVPQYLGANLIVEGFAVKNTCPLPLLRPSNHSASKSGGPGKVKESTVEKLPPLPKVVLKRAESMTKSRKAMICPTLPSESSVHKPVHNIKVKCK